MNGTTTRRTTVAGLLTASFAGQAAAQGAAQAPKPVKIGVLTDQNGALSDLSGSGSIEAVKMAVEDFGGSVLGRPVEVVFADHQNKPEIAVSIALQWFDNGGVDMITDLVNSSVALAVQDIARTRGKITLSSTGGTLALMGKQCSATGAVWANDTYSASVGLVRYFLRQQGKKLWFLIGADYAFGHSMVEQAAKAIEAGGGRVMGSVFHPLGTADLTSYLLTAQSSGAEAILFGNASSDLVNCVKQARELGLKQTLAATVVTVLDIRAIGLPTAQGLTYLTSFYWGWDDQTRAFAQRFFARHHAMPTQFQAGGYSTTLTYLKAVKAAGTTDGTKVMEEIHRMKVEDVFSRNGHVRIDGRLVHDMLIAQVKQPAQSKGEWDVCNVIDVLQGDQVFRPLSESDCPLVRT